MDRLRGALERSSAAALVVIARSSRDPFLAPWVGAARLGPALVVCPRRGAARLAYLTPLERDEAARSGLALLSPEDLDLARWARGGAPAGARLTALLERALQRCGVAPGVIALAGQAEAGALALALASLAADGWRFLDGAPILRAWRKRKRAAELAEIRRVAATACEAMWAVAHTLASAETVNGVLVASGQTVRVGTLRQQVARYLVGAGLEQPEGNLIAPGATGAVPHNTGDDGQAVHAGRSLVVDLFPRGRLFADLTRTFCVATPPGVLEAAHRTVRGALAVARAGVRPGVHGCELQQAVCEHFARAGYPTPLDHPGSLRGYVHGLGHGVGYEVHEQPCFHEHEGASGRLEIGDVFTLEPGLYDPQAGYAVRLEDTCSLGPNGLEILTPLPEALDPRAWAAAAE